MAMAVREVTMTMMSAETEVSHCYCSDQESGGRRQSRGGEVLMSGTGFG
jgi:hypothetical protein